MSKLYLECNSGISGDMTVAALLDLGADEKALRDALSTVLADEYKIEISRVKKAGLDCCDFNVILNNQDNHDHDMEYLHGHSHSHDHAEHHHDHEEHHHDHAEHHHDHEEHHHDHAEHHHDHAEHHHDHEEHHHDHAEHHHHHHAHRGIADVRKIIEAASITEGANRLANKIFDVLAIAESKAHGVPVEEVHFHEVGAVDSIVDILAIAICLDNLGIDEVIVPYVCEGMGTVRCQHGILPVPVPAVANIVADNNVVLQRINVEGEFVTPTGAAVVAAICTSKTLPEKYSIKRIGMGAGKRTYERPSVLRAMLIDEIKPEPGDSIIKLETNIDDCTGENLGFVMEKLFVAGARDVYYTPIYMKKNRPAYLLSVICDECKVSEFEKIIFHNTTTIGIRRTKLERTMLNRTIKELELPEGQAKIKVCEFGDEVKFYPEYESVKMLCEKRGISYQDAYNALQQMGEMDE